jgi:biuret amidohydrolase
LKKVPDFGHERIVMIAVDMQNEYGCDGYNRWAAWNWDETAKNARKILDACRENGYPVVHVRVARDPDGIMCHEYDAKDENGKPIYSVKGTKKAEFCDLMKPLPGELIVEKQRFSAFYQTNLELILQGLHAQHLIMVGGFTDSCFLTSVYDAFTRGYTISIIKDAVTCGSEGAHKANMLTMANWIYGSSIFKADEMVKAIHGEPYTAWFWEESNSMSYEVDTINELYEQL